MSGPQYTPERRAEAIGLARTVGSSVAMQRTGIPRRTIDRWLLNPTPQDTAVIVQSRDAVAGKLWEAVTEGTEQVLRRMRDPKARLSDIAQALRVVSEQHALLTGGVTERTEMLQASQQFSEAEAVAMRRVIDAALASSDEQLLAEMPAWLAWLSGRNDLARGARTEIREMVMAGIELDVDTPQLTDGRTPE